MGETAETSDAEEENNARKRRREERREEKRRGKKRRKEDERVDKRAKDEQFSGFLEIASRE